MAIVFFSDFGFGDIYVGQVKGELQRLAPPIPVIDLLHEAPAFKVRASAHLLAALAGRFAPDSIFLAVVDPGVGGPRNAVVMQADGRWYVGPDNGLLSVVAARALKGSCARILWRPDLMSDSFHGRDLFAPIAAHLAVQGSLPRDWIEHRDGLEIEFGGDDLPEIIYIDHYGNAQSGIRASGIPRDAVLIIGDRRIHYAQVFSAAEVGRAFWYENSLGLVEIAVNRASASQALGLKIGDRLAWA